MKVKAQVTPKPSANERRLAKLLREEANRNDADYDEGGAEQIAAYLAKRGVLAVSVKTITNDDARRISYYYHPEAHLRPELRRLARGIK